MGPRIFRCIFSKYQTQFSVVYSSILSRVPRLLWKYKKCVILWLQKKYLHTQYFCEKYSGLVGSFWIRVLFQLHKVKQYMDYLGHFLLKRISL